MPRDDRELDEVLRRAFGGQPPRADFAAWRDGHADALRGLRPAGAAGPTFLRRLLPLTAAAAAVVVLSVLSVVLRRAAPPIADPQPPPAAAALPRTESPTFSLYACGDVGLSATGAFDLDGLNLSLPDAGRIVPAVTMSLDVPTFSALPPEPERSLP